ncbi:type II methionyl aminopeptidase [Candidatus Woesearchaeota archaeon]|nr:type II methionyl aminopeptidase [Candidatus Woesearchaeota archaeon]
MEGFEDFIKAGNVAAQALEYGRKLIKVDAKMLDVCDAIEKKIFELGGKPAFPVQINLNQIAAHYCPTDDDATVFKEGDVVKLDVGAHVDGAVGDNACTVDLGNNSELVKASLNALNAAIKLATPGTTLGSIGQAINSEIESSGFKPIVNLSGHGIGRFIIHGPPTIPNFDTGDKTELKENQTIAIEPFATTGAGRVYESGHPTIFMVKAKKPARGPFARQVLAEIEGFDGLPFASRWVSGKLGVGRAKFGINELVKLGVLHGFPPLPEEKGGLVSQAEHSIIVNDKPKITTKL